MKVASLAEVHTRKRGFKFSIAPAGLVGMERGELETERRIGTVKAAIGLFGERFAEANSALKKSRIGSSERRLSRSGELHQARMDIGRFSQSRRIADSIKAEAESELSGAKQAAIDLTSRIKEFNSKAHEKIHDLERMKKPGMGDNESASAVRKIKHYQYAEVMRELKRAKQELSKLKLDLASVLEEKIRADEESEDSCTKISSYTRSAEALRTEIEAANEEQVLVELARIEAIKELKATEAQRQEEANQFSRAMENAKKKINDALEEIDNAKELEMKLAITTSDVNALQNELKLVKEMDRSVQRDESKGQQLYSPLQLELIKEELETKTKELASIKEEGFQLMASMDSIRNELKNVSQEAARLKKTAGKADLSVQNLNSKLLRAKAKLEALSAAEEKAKTIASNLSLTLEQLRTDTEAAKKERELITAETEKIRGEVQKNESEIDLAEAKLEAAMQELEDAKSSEEMALEKLKDLVENIIRTRASASQKSSTITISRFEYEYLTGRAVGAKEIADKKVAAAQAWVEAIKANEKNILMKTEMAVRKIRELKVVEGEETYRTQKSLSAKSVVEKKLEKWKEKPEKNSQPESWKLEGALSRRSRRENGSLTPAGRVKFRKSASPAIRKSASGSFTVKRRRKIMPKLAKFFNSRTIEMGA
ncbi:protein PLASTID MOVEMENT IMPAIRED 2 [Diospyros lotus]|uniref:protein PLASTID MOVEMENT IMPAIRED 2 n=1 Tax=Diospyros lotus TaxID=55363 RepID=UPI002250E571|nr:protein PLASTID MOVEMENT IMPAIRED 2 [Diospyros lotus]XP_052196295.1 protein PLASTID MOVEMENT IMPAIRED 2 [Diospyros lotus]